MGAAYSYGTILRIYEGSDGDATKALYDALVAYGAAGEIATNLFRAHKSSSRAKVYRGGVRGQGSYKGMAYDRKQWSIDNLCKALSTHSDGIGIKWGWGEDKTESYHPHVLYVDTPAGQVSFHNTYRGMGRSYDGAWDGVRGEGHIRICKWIATLFNPAQGPRKVRYIGDAEHLKDKTALVFPNAEFTPGAQIKVQFDDLSVQEAYGWWTFNVADLELIEERG